MALKPSGAALSFFCVGTPPVFLSEKRSTGVAEGTMVRRRFQEAKKGFEYLKSINYDKYLRKVGMGREDQYFWRRVGMSLLYVYAIGGALWWYNETSPHGWWPTRRRPKEERDLAHMHERIESPVPGDQEAMDEVVASGKMTGTSIGPKGIVEEDDGWAFNNPKEMQKKKFEQEAQKMWLEMRNEVIQELREKGYDVE